MNHIETVNKRLWWKYMEPAIGTYECVAWAKLYCTERGRIPLGRFGGVGAYQWWLNNNRTFNTDFYQKVPNDPQLVPSQGDIIIFKPTATNIHWHIAIVENADIRAITVIEQNGASGDWDGDGGDEIRKANYTYKNVAWWYHFKQKQTVAPIVDPLLQRLIDDWIWNGKEWDGVTNRIALLIAKSKYT